VHFSLSDLLVQNAPDGEELKDLSAFLGKKNKPRYILTTCISIKKTIDCSCQLVIP
jgi:hypothetical protein